MASLMSRKPRLVLFLWGPPTLIAYNGFRGRVFKAIWGEGCRLCDFLLIGWWWGNRAVLQKSCAQSEVSILHLGGALVPAELRDRCCVYLLRKNQGPSFHCYNIISWGLHLSLTYWLASLWICPLELREGLGGWSLFFFKKAKKKKKEKKRGQRKYLYQGGPHRLLLGFTRLDAIWFELIFAQISS